ncbi:MAG TPA: hypothetical protein EYQ50_05530 [Verrucomicrobiales bacterium]|jgi:tetratricopeptide (TPR) repeat protein|nr:hypothetical protein [Verrucomicrobiales bacterium]HIL69485.1 hypothetical protein [Verrucomicrobiota bacterium]
MAGVGTNEEAQLLQTIEMFEVITQSQPDDYQSLEILKEAYAKLGRQEDSMKTSKRIAEAYVQKGQLSSAILEYESILQLFPEDPDVKSALAEIESKATSFSSPDLPDYPGDDLISFSPDGSSKTDSTAKEADAIDDGRAMMSKLYVDTKKILEEEFNRLWPTPGLNIPPVDVTPSFIEKLSDGGGMPIDESLKVLVERSRVAYLSIESYDTDIELCRSFSAETCRRWCVLPVDKLSKSLIAFTCNPFNKQATLELEEQSKGRIIWYLTKPDELTKLIKKMFI